MATLAGKAVGRTGYGMMNLTWRQNQIPDAQAFATMKAALKSGANLWNAGEVYGTPESNSLHLLNRYFTKYPEDSEKVVLCIKGSAIPGKMAFSNKEENIRRSIDECLRVLGGKKFLDIFETARQDPDVPLEETMNAMAQYVKEGKLGGIGLSEVTADQIRAAVAIHPIVSVEVELSLQTPDILSNGVALTCAELKIPIIAYSPLGRGLLTAQINSTSDIDPTDLRHHLPRFAPENIEKNAAMGAEVQKLAKKNGATPAQVALAWVRSFSNNHGFGTIVPIPGSTTQERATENCQEITLSDAELKEVEEIMKKNAVAGSRYPEMWK